METEGPTKPRGGWKTAHTPLATAHRERTRARNALRRLDDGFNVARAQALERIRTAEETVRRLETNSDGS